MNILYGRTQDELAAQVQEYVAAGRLMAVSPPAKTRNGLFKVRVWLDGDLPTTPAPAPRPVSRPTVTPGRIAAALAAITVTAAAAAVWAGNRAADETADAAAEARQSAAAVSGWLSDRSGWWLLIGLILVGLGLFAAGARREAQTKGTRK